MMSFLSKLQITQLKRNPQQTPEQARRAKLVTKLEEQLALVQAQAKGERLLVTKPSWTRDDDGNKIRVQRERQVKPWWFPQGTELHMVIRYGARQIELAKGKRAIVVATHAMLPGALNTMIQAVQAGELDAAIAAALDARKLKLPKA